MAQMAVRRRPNNRGAVAKSPVLAHRINSRQRSTSVAFGAKQTLTEPALTESGFMSTRPSARYSWPRRPHASPHPLQSGHHPANDSPHAIIEGGSPMSLTIRRVVTGHDKNGRAIVSIDESV